MKVQLESTDRIIRVDNSDCRLWSGTTEDGIKCHAFIRIIGVHKDDNAAEFDRDLESLPFVTVIDIAGMSLRVVL